MQRISQFKRATGIHLLYAALLFCDGSLATTLIAATITIAAIAATTDDTGQEQPAQFNPLHSPCLTPITTITAATTATACQFKPASERSQ